MKLTSYDSTPFVSGDRPDNVLDSLENASLKLFEQSNEVFWFFITNFNEICKNLININKSGHTNVFMKIIATQENQWKGNFVTQISIFLFYQRFQWLRSKNIFLC